MSQKEWLFPIDALKVDSETAPEASTSSAATSEARAKGVEYLFRVGVQLQMSLSAILTAATYFHRFYMRQSILDYTPTCVASASILIASKSEECGRRLKDVAMVCMSKATSGLPPLEDEQTELEEWQNTILRTEDLMLEVLGFDFAVQHPHAVLSEIFTDHSTTLTVRRDSVEDLAWSITTDSFRTPLCALFDPATIACACIAIAVALADGETTSYLDQLLSCRAGSEFPSENGAVDAVGSEFFQECINHYDPRPEDLQAAITILLQYYRFQWYPSGKLAPGQDHFLAPIANLPIPKGSHGDIKLFTHPLQDASPNPSMEEG